MSAILRWMYRTFEEIEIFFWLDILKMKKFSATILAILYLSTSMGATVNLHYCMGKLVDWSVWHSSNTKCGNCGMKKSHDSMGDGCCKDEYKQIKNDKDQKLSENSTQLSKTIIEIAPVKFPNNSISLPLVLFQRFRKANSPTRICEISLNVLNFLFRI